MSNNKYPSLISVMSAQPSEPIRDWVRACRINLATGITKTDRSENCGGVGLWLDPRTDLIVLPYNISIEIAGKVEDAMRDVYEGREMYSFPVDEKFWVFATYDDPDRDTKVLMLQSTDLVRRVMS